MGGDVRLRVAQFLANLWQGELIAGVQLMVAAYIRVWVRLADMPPSRLIVAWHAADANPLVHSFVELAAPSSRRQRAPR